MAVVNVGTTITKARTKFPGGISRAPFVVWFNEVVQEILNQPRVWKFLTEPITLAIVNNQITIPAGVSEIVSIQVGDTFFTQSDQLSDQEAAKIDAASDNILQADSTDLVTPPSLQGYTLTAAGVVVFHPALTGTASVIGEQNITADYADSADTIFPLDFQELFILGLRMSYYDLQKDGRFTKENMLYQMAMGKAKSWDNRHKPRPHYNSHGYIRGGN